MFLTIIIPHYNNVALLGRCVHSLMAAELGDVLQVVVVDDGSSPDQRAKIDDMVSGLEVGNVQLVCNSSNRGASFSRNRGLQYATGRFVWFVDADDEVDSDLLRSCWPKLSRISDQVDLLHLGPMVTPGDKRGSKPHDVCVESTTLADMMKPRSHCLDHTTYWINRQFLIRNPHIRYLEDCEILEDSIFVLQMLETARYFMSAEGCSLYIHHTDAHSITAGVWSKDKSATFMPCILKFFGHLSHFMDKQKGIPYMEDLYHRYCYVYMRVLAVKGVPEELYRDMFFNPLIRNGFIPRNIKEYLLKNSLIHSFLSLVCRILRPSHN